MKIKLTVDGGMWANSEEFPQNMQTESGFEYYGYYDDIQKVWGMVMAGLFHWLTNITVIKINHKEWKVISSDYHDKKDRVVARVEIQ